MRGHGTYDELEYCFILPLFVTTRESEDDDAAGWLGSRHPILFVGGFCIAEKATKDMSFSDVTFQAAVNTFYGSNDF